MGDDPAKKLQFSKKKSGSRRAIYHWATEPLEFGKNSLPRPRTFSRGKIIEIPRFLGSFLDRQRCYNISAGGDATENEDFQKRKQRFIFHGGDLMKNHDFHKGKMVAVGCFSKIHFSDGNDATESDDFQKVKQDNQKLWGTMRQKMAIFKRWNSVCRGATIFRCVILCKKFVFANEAIGSVTISWTKCMLKYELANNSEQIWFSYYLKYIRANTLPGQTVRPNVSFRKDIFYVLIEIWYRKFKMWSFGMEALT